MTESVQRFPMKGFEVPILLQGNQDILGSGSVPVHRKNWTGFWVQVWDQFNFPRTTTTMHTDAL